MNIPHRGQQHTATFKSKAAAQEWAGKTEMRLKSYISGQAGKTKTVADALKKYAAEVSPGKKGARWETIRLAKFETYAFADVFLADLLPYDLAEWRDLRLKEVAAPSVLRELQLLSSVFNTAKMEWNWMTENPCKFIQSPPNSRPRVRRVTEIEIESLKIQLNYEPGVKIRQAKQLTGAFFLLAIETAMRLGEMCKLRADNINIEERFVELIDTKNGTDRKIPLSKPAIEILRDVIATDVTVGSEVAGASFRKACKLAKIEGLHFHDTRHEATTRLAQKLDVMDLARMTGHQDLRQLLRYYNATPQEIANRLD